MKIISLFILLVLAEVMLSHRIKKWLNKNELEKMYVPNLQDKAFHFGSSDTEGFCSIFLALQDVSDFFLYNQNYNTKNQIKMGTRIEITNASLGLESSSKTFDCETKRNKINDKIKQVKEHLVKLLDAKGELKTKLLA